MSKREKDKQRETKKRIIKMTAFIVAISTIVCVGILGLTRVIHAAETEKVDWKTHITQSPSTLDDIFTEYDEPKTMYTTTRVNMRSYPNIKWNNVKRVLNLNSEVKVVGEYNGWYRIIATDEKSGEECERYIWGRYVSKNKTVVKK